MKRACLVATHEIGTEATSDDLELSDERLLQKFKKARSILDSLSENNGFDEDIGKEAITDNQTGNPSSQFSGVHGNRRLKKWRVRIKVQGQDIHIGYFDDERAAASALERAIVHYDRKRSNSSLANPRPLAAECSSQALSAGSGINMILAAIETEASSNPELQSRATAPSPPLSSPGRQAPRAAPRPARRPAPSFP